MDQPDISRPTHVHNDDRIMSRYEVDAYRERTFEEAKQAQADRLADMRMRAIEQAFGMMNRTPVMYSLSDVFNVADEIVNHVRNGS